jgi:hypothetical protein
MASFEVQRYTGSGWVPHSDFDDKTFAIEAAKDLMSGKRAPGAARVVEVFSDDRPPRTVYRQSTLEEQNIKARREQFDLVREVEAARAARKAERVGRRTAATVQPKRYGYFSPLMVCVVFLAIAGYAAVLAAQHFLPR